MGKTVHIVPSDICDFIRYDELTGELFWTAAPSRRGKPVEVGAQAGHRRPSGYIDVQFRGVKYPATHVIYFLKTGGQAVEVDHIDLNPSNNRWRNLRHATNAQNATNRRGWGKFRKGVQFDRRSGSYRATITSDGVAHYLGTFVTEDAAHTAYCAAATQLHGEFARVA